LLKKSTATSSYEPSDENEVRKMETKTCRVGSIVFFETHEPREAGSLLVYTRLPFAKDPRHTIDYFRFDEISDETLYSLGRLLRNGIEGRKTSAVKV
jgi:hypothetical protein